MGAVFAKSSVDVLNDIAISSTQSVLSECLNSATLEQLIRIKNVKGDVIFNKFNLQQSSSFDATCILNTQLQNNLQTKIANDIANYAESRGPAVLSLFGVSKLDAVTNIKNMLKVNVNQESINRALNTMSQRQGIDIENVGGNVHILNTNVKQSNNFISKTIIENTQYANVINEIGNKIEQKAGSDSNIIDLNKLFGVTSILCFIYFIFLLLLSSSLLLAFYSFNSKGTSIKI